MIYHDLEIKKLAAYLPLINQLGHQGSGLESLHSALDREVPALHLLDLLRVHFPTAKCQIY